jgi:hypothetical protein
MIIWGRHSERAIAAAAAVLLQAAVYMALSQRHAAVPHAASAPTIIALILAAARPKREPPPALQPRERRKLRLTAVHPVTPPIIPSKPQSQPSRPSLDWQGAIQGEVRKELARASEPPRKRFDLPARPALEAPPHEWDGWDETRTHRIQRLAHGIIDLGHGCYILLFPPIPQCHSEPPEGDLFDHMRDRRNEVPGSLP